MSYIEKKPNVVDLCRLCLAKDETLIQVFDSVQIDQILCDKIKECLAIKISTQDRVSQKICGSCLIKVDTFYEFRSISLESQRVLQGWLLDLDNVAIDIHSKEPEIHTEKVIDVDYPLENSSEEEGFENESGSTDEGSSFGVSEERVAEQGVGQIQPDVTNILPITQSAGPSGLQPSEKGKSAPMDSVEKEEQSFICDFCQKKFKNKDSLMKHREKRADHKQCEICGKEFPTTAKLLNHARIHSKKYVCSLCPYASKSSSNFKIHLMKHNKQFLIECEECGKGFYNLSYYREHKAVKHSNEIVVNKCETCEKAFHSKFYLRQHTKLHSPDFVKKKFQCEVCGKTFQSWKGVKRHINTVHEGNMYTCDSCAKQVTSLQSLKKHKKIHSGEKTFVCDICGKGFIAINNLIAHERIHTGERPYKCEACSKCFAQKTTLKVHQRCHSGERPYQCQMCTKRFATHSHLKKHGKVHSKPSAISFLS